MSVEDPPHAEPARLRWLGADFLPPEVRVELLGPGAPFELRPEPVLGTELEVFARRPRSLRGLLDQAVARHPDWPFLVSADRTWTFAQAAHDIDAVADRLARHHGIEAGDRVAIVAANSAEYGLVMWAVLTLGGVVASLNGWWTTAELAYGIELSQPSLIAGDARRLARLPEDLPTGLEVVELADLVGGAGVGDPISPLSDGAVGPTAASIDEDDPAVLLFTSGTTGVPKGATLSHRNIIHFGMSNQLSAAIGAALRPESADREAPAGPVDQPASILSSPMFHVSGMIGILLSGPALGNKLVFPPPGRWDEGRHLEMTVEHGITGWSGVPTQWWRILRHPDLDDYDLSRVRVVGGGGAACPPELLRLLAERLPQAVLGNGYGMSETVGFGTILQGPLVAMAPDTVGVAQAGGQVEIRDPAGRVVTGEEVGEIYLRSPSVFLGYWGDPDATAACLDADRWYRTGDFGRITGGMLQLESRMRDLILRGGENIYPLEIENRLVEHPDIDDAAVIGVDHPELGQEVKAFVVLRAGAELEPAEVQAWAAETLAPFKVPAHVERRDALPYTDTGKVLKQQLEREERAGREG